jgi:ABC-type transporter Mla subunit MlaD
MGWKIALTGHVGRGKRGRNRRFGRLGRAYRRVDGASWAWDRQEAGGKREQSDTCVCLTSYLLPPTYYSPVPPAPHPLARPVGYALVLTLLIGLVLAVGFLVHEATRSPRLIRVRFPEIATLGEGDPVVQGGVQVGEVESIRLTGSETLVEIELFHHRPLAQDARFVNFSHSLMGARKVWIVPGGSPLPLDESRIQEGVFAPGLAEMLHKVDSLVVVIARLRDETERLLAGDDPGRSPLAATVLLEGRLDTAARQLDQITGHLVSARVALMSGLQDLTSAAGRARRGVLAAEPPARSALSQARDLLDAMETIQRNLDTLLARVEKVTALAGDSTAAGRLLKEDSAYVRLEKSVRVLEGLANLMRKDGLGDSLKIRPRVRKSTQ